MGTVCWLVFSLSYLSTSVGSEKRGMAGWWLIFRLCHFDHNSDALVGTYWLRVPARIVVKVAMQTYRALHSAAPLYLRQFACTANILSQQRVLACTPIALFVPAIRLPTVGHCTNIYFPFLLLVHVSYIKRFTFRAGTNTGFAKRKGGADHGEYWEWVYKGFYGWSPQQGPGAVSGRVKETRKTFVHFPFSQNLRSLTLQLHEMYRSYQRTTKRSSCLLLRTILKIRLIDWMIDNA